MGLGPAPPVLKVPGGRGLGWAGRRQIISRCVIVTGDQERVCWEGLWRLWEYPGTGQW